MQTAKMSCWIPPSTTVHVEAGPQLKFGPAWDYNSSQAQPLGFIPLTKMLTTLQPSVCSALVTFEGTVVCTAQSIRNALKTEARHQSCLVWSRAHMTWWHTRLVSHSGPEFALRGNTCGCGKPAHILLQDTKYMCSRQERFGLVYVLSGQFASGG